MVCPPSSHARPSKWHFPHCCSVLVHVFVAHEHNLITFTGVLSKEEEYLLQELQKAHSPQCDPMQAGQGFSLRPRWKKHLETECKLENRRAYGWNFEFYVIYAVGVGGVAPNFDFKVLSYHAFPWKLIFIFNEIHSAELYSFQVRDVTTANSPDLEDRLCPCLERKLRPPRKSPSVWSAKYALRSCSTVWVAPSTSSWARRR